MSASEGEASKTHLQILEKKLIKEVMLALRNEGRLLPYDELGVVLMEKNGDLLEHVLLEDSSYNLMKLVKSCPHIFYLLQNGPDLFVSLSRDFIFFVPRLAKVLQDVHDKKREKVLSCKKFESELPNYSRISERFNEYEFAKCAWTLLEILNVVIRSVARDKNRVLLKRVTDKYRTLSGLAKSLLNFCGCVDGPFEDFFYVFDYFFEMRDSLLFVDFYLLDGFVMSIETDLIWSYTGCCVCQGQTSINDLMLEVNAFIQRARLSFVKEVTKEYLMSMLQCRRELYFLPGDDTVWVMDPCPRFNKSQLLDMEDFWTRYLKRKRVHYSECLDIFVRRVPEKAQDLADESFLTIASYLYSLPKVFQFKEGMISLVRNASDVVEFPEVPPVDVPTNLKVYSRCVLEVSKDVIGTVKEVGIESCIISFDDDFVAENTATHSEEKGPIKADAYCDVCTTLCKGERIKDFTDILKKGDYVKFLYKFHEKPDMFCPLLSTALIIVPLTEASIIEKSKEYCENVKSDFTEGFAASDSACHSKTQFSHRSL